MAHAHLGHEPLLGAPRPRQPKVADFEVAVRVEQQVAGLQVPVEDAGGVDVFEAAQDLVHEVLAVLLRQRLGRPYDLVQVRVHELIDQVHVPGGVPAAALGGGEQHVQEGDHVVVHQVPQQADLTQRPPRVRPVLEAVGHLLDSHPGPGGAVGGAAHHPVGPLTQPLDRRVALPQLKHKLLAAAPHAHASGGGSAVVAWVGWWAGVCEKRCPAPTDDSHSSLCAIPLQATRRPTPHRGCGRRHGPRACARVGERACTCLACPAAAPHSLGWAQAPGQACWVGTPTRRGRHTGEGWWGCTRAVAGAKGAAEFVAVCHVTHRDPDT